ncbi:dual specificity protein phosphatase 19 [Anthonomus grandis grandis]|uniref:dual specificity protein phosphatase 19 n=1 Tax=Anthonomus grandis grandis TaxID=2921223 RepID=UPI00216614AF|nr:dual specificity protein phosphatase 19 [Anthonomus grandis grandis]
MSFLSELREKKKHLKPTETVVTQEDGKIFVVSNSIVKKLDKVSTGFIIDLKPDDVPAKIVDYLYLGSQDCCDPSVLEGHQIKHVLSLGVEPAKTPDINYKFVKILDLDNANLLDILPKCLDFIESSLNRRENLLVHCNAGVSRSASVVIAYLVIKRKLMFDEAYEIVKLARPCIRPNDGFMLQLRRLKPT